MGGMCPDGTDYHDCGYCPEYFHDNGFCDEPEGRDYCPDETDPLDCCASVNGICEEVGMGGECPVGSDNFDCGVCQFTEDGYCDEPEGTDLCAEDSDFYDCCAVVQNGICEEEGMGGECPPTTDLHDCGYCPWEGDGDCDEPEGNDLCAEGTDPEDCP